MSIVRWKPIIHQPSPMREYCAGLLPAKNPPLPWRRRSRLPIRHSKPIPSAISCGGLSRTIRRRELPVVRAGVAEMAAEGTDVLFSKSFPLKRTQTVEGKITVRLDPVLAAEEVSGWRLVVGCNLEGSWILHWGVSYRDDFQSEWDQPPLDMRPPGSISIKDYAIETPLKKSSSTLEGNILHELQIDINGNTDISAIHFVLKEEVTGAWFQHKGRDFRIPLMNYVEDNDLVGKQGLSIWPGALGQLSSLLLNAEGSSPKLQGSTGETTKQQNRQTVGFYEEFPILKEELVEHNLTVSVRKNNENGKSLVQFDTDIPGKVIIHWGVCKDDQRKWEIPSTPHPPETKIFRNKALQTSLQPKLDVPGSLGSFQVDEDIFGVVFVLKHNELTWFNDRGTDFYIPIASTGISLNQTSGHLLHELADIESNSIQEDVTHSEENSSSLSSNTERSKSTSMAEPLSNNGDNQGVVYTNEIIKEIRNLVTDISSEGKGTQGKEAQEGILREIEKLAAEAYRIFRGSTQSFVEEVVSEVDQAKPVKKVSSGTGSGYEILCQGFNWESHKSGRWYSELSAKTKELASLGFTIVWLPPPTESVSPEGYMPKDLYNLTSRYGTIEELKELVKKFHEDGIKVLGDAVLNHRCAHYQNKNGIWNIFGGRMNWDDRAIVADDPHFQGRGNKSSGDNFHAAPNIDHSQEFVREDLKEWLCWLRKEVGYDGWRLDFVRGFWGGYVKDYMEASEPYFAVGEYWDSLSYTYGEMDYNQDAHRQRIIDWINATNGAAGAFDVTTKGILHTALQRCEYWRLSDQNGKPPGVVGWWPSRAVTFIENHDTGSTQGHWRFPSGKEMQGYAYILTHPGTPTVFYDHIFSHYQLEISRLISVRHQNKIHCRSTVKIIKAEGDVYAAEVDEKIAMKIGPGHFEPLSNGSGKWILAAEGNDYKVWERS